MSFPHHWKDHPHLRDRGTVRTICDRIAGKFDIAGMPLKFSEFPSDLPLEAPTLGPHNREILCEVLGRSAKELEQSRAAKELQVTEHRGPYARLRPPGKIPDLFGGPSETRTPDPLIKSQLLYQLS